MNRIKYSFILATLAIIFMVSCSTSELVKPNRNSDDLIQFSIQNSNLVNPISLVKNLTTGESAIWLEINNQKVNLEGVGDVEISSDHQFVSSWTIDERKVSISFEQQADGIHFSLKAEPSEGITQWGMNIASSPGEYFIGLFERTVDGNQSESWKKGIKEAMNLRGQKVDMIIKPTLSLYTPFHISSAGYGLFFEGTWPGQYDFCATNPNVVSIAFEGAELSGIIYCSDQPAELVKAHSLHVGPTIVPPKWAFTPWRWRDNHVNNKTYYDGTKVSAPYNSQLVEDILMMKAFDIPCGLYWVDRPWAKGSRGYSDFDWDPERFPEAQNMLDWIHQNDMRFMLWIAPWVMGDMKEEAIAKGYDQPIKDGNQYGVYDVALIDFTNPEACKWLQEKGIEKMLKQGVDGFKLDRAEEIVTASMDVVLNDGRTSREVRNDYPVLYVKTVNEACQNIKGDDFVLIPRAGYTGSSKYSGFWGGDIGSEPEGLRAAIIAMQRSSIIGFPIWGSDIGGYWQGDLDREVTARWLAFGCFCPIMEFGPTEDRAPWDMDSEPNYDVELLAVWRLYAKLHNNLADYSHQLALEASETGMPIVRPLFLSYPDQELAWTEWQSYLYGPDILVYNIWEKGTSEVSVYLPEGDRWIDAWDTSKVYEGGQSLEVETPYHKIPLFIREGSSVDLGDLEALYQESMKIAAVKPDLTELEKVADF